MNTIAGALHLEISVGAKAFQRYPAGFSTVIESGLNVCLFCLYLHVHQDRCNF